MRMTTIKNAKTQKRIGIVEAESEFMDLVPILMDVFKVSGFFKVEDEEEKN